MVELEQDQYFPYFFFFFFFFPLFLLVLFAHKLFFTSSPHKTTSSPPEVPGTYPIVGSILSMKAHQRDLLDWFTTLHRSSSTIVLRRPLGHRDFITVKPANVEHILKTKFSTYPKGSRQSSILGDFLGGGIFNVDGEDWRFQRQVAIHEFGNNSLRKFIEQVVEAELHGRLIPIIQNAAGKVLDLQDLLQRFAFDNICKIAYGYDPEYLIPSMPESPIAVAFDEAVDIINMRFRCVSPLQWKLKRLLNVGSERKLRSAVAKSRDFARSIVREKMRQAQVNRSTTGEYRSAHHSGSPLAESEPADDLNLLSRFVRSGEHDEQFITDIVISFILAGRDTTSSALTWFFWLLTRHPKVEARILKEIKSIDDDNNNKNNQTKTKSAYDEAKRDLIYTQAAIFESMRFYPPLPIDAKQAADEDTWPDGTVVPAGTMVVYNVYGMGRIESIWGKDWAEYRPERWLEEREDGRLGFVNRDPYSYPVFQAGPRICLGKEMAILQMKRVAAGVLKRFRVVSAKEEYEPVYLPTLTARMEGGFPVKFERRG